MAFAPSLFLGATLGAAWGTAAHTLFPDWTATAGAYALVGMGAMVAATTHAPITAILIIFELTATYKIILPLMISCIISTIITTSLKRGSIYTIKLARRGVELSQGWEQRVLQTLKIQDVMDHNVVAVPESMPLPQIFHELKSRNVSHLYVVNKDGGLTGIISFRDIRPALKEEALERLIIAKDLATIDLATISPTDSIFIALQKMSSRGISQLPVVAEDDAGKLIGTVSQRDVMSAYNRAVLQREDEGY